MNSETVIGAVIAALIGMFTAVMALLVQEGVTSIGDISQLAWIVVGIGALISFLKDYQALTTRKAIAKLTGGDT
jgi:uncharacterized membrane protein YuzA (DUF378 family)